MNNKKKIMCEEEIFGMPGKEMEKEKHKQCTEDMGGHLGWPEPGKLWG